MRATSTALPHLVVSAAQMRQADAAAIASGTSGYTLMRRAGEAVADRAVEFLSGGERVLAVCGPGNNGGDGFVAARILRERGFSVEVALLGPVSNLAGDAALAAGDWAGPVLPLDEIDPAAAALVIVGLFGTGLSRPVEGAARQAIETINGSGQPVLAIDIPSGVDADTGQVHGVAVRANATVTFVRSKPGHLLLPGRVFCGDLRVVDIGIGDVVVAGTGARTFVNHPDLWRASLPRPSEDGHKYERGHTLVCSGPATRTGAARLAARAALRIGSGLVTLASPGDALAENGAHLTAIMLRPCDGESGLAELLADKRFSTVCAGPGLGDGEPTRAIVRVAAASGRALVLDADALTSFEGEAALLGGLLGAGAQCRAVLTPHGGEFKRLFAGETQVLEAASKLDRARLAAERVGAVLVLKGADTVIAAPDGRAAINATGTPYLATAGSGDVLAGIVAGLLAQGMPAFEAACAAVWLHGETGRRFGPGLIAEDLPETLPAVLRELLA